MKKFLVFLLSFMFIFKVDALQMPDVTCKNILFIDLDNDNIIYEKNSNEKVSIASITKVMTALVSIENIDNFDEKIVITSDMISNIGYDYIKVGFKTGDVVTYNDLLYGALLRSGADATNILGISISGSIDDFVKLMNKKADELGLTNTSFSNTIGMDNKNNYSTAKDVAKLFTYAFSNDKFKEIITTESYITSNSSFNIGGILKLLHNNEYNMNYILGGKTGYTNNAGECLVSISNYDNHNYLLVVLGSNDNNKYQHFIDSKTIYEYFFNNFEYRKILTKGSIITKIKTIYDEEYIINSKKDVTKYMDKNIDIDDLKYEYVGKTIIDKNTKKGDKIGTYYIKNNDEVLYEEDIYLDISVRMTLYYFIKNNILLLSFFLLAVILSIICVNKNKKNRKNNTR